MFGRLKQNIREKTGRAQASKLPEELENKILYVEAWEKRDKQASKALNEAIESWKKCQKMVDLVANLEEMEKLLDNKLAEGAKDLGEHLEERIGALKPSYEKCTNTFENRMHTFIKTELRAMTESMNLLKKKRLTKDGCAIEYEKKPTDERKIKAETSEADFNTQLAACESLLKKIPEYDQMHADAFVATAKALAGAF